MTKFSNYIILFCLIAFAMSANLFSEPYNYPIRPGSEAWNKAGSYEERVKLCQIPDDILGEMETDDLIETVLDFPFISNLTFLDNMKQGALLMAESFNGLKELLERDGAADIILEKYYNLPKEYSAMNTAIIEIFLSMKSIQDGLSREQKSELAVLLVEKSKRQIRTKSYSDTYANKTRAYILARLLVNLDWRPLLEMKHNDRKLHLFIEESILIDKRAMNITLLEGVKYSKSLKG